MALERDVSQTICSLEHNGCRLAAVVLRIAAADAHKRAQVEARTCDVHVRAAASDTKSAPGEAATGNRRDYCILTYVILLFPHFLAASFLSFSFGSFSPSLLCFFATERKQDACDRPEALRHPSARRARECVCFF